MRLLRTFPSALCGAILGAGGAPERCSKVVRDIDIRAGE